MSYEATLQPLDRSSAAALRSQMIENASVESATRLSFCL
jgi:hypothetical protein